MAVSISWFTDLCGLSDWWKQLYLSVLSHWWICFISLCFHMTCGFYGKHSATFFLCSKVLICTAEWTLTTFVQLSELWQRRMTKIAKSFETATSGFESGFSRLRVRRSNRYVTATHRWNWLRVRRSNRYVTATHRWNWLRVRRSNRYVTATHRWNWLRVRRSNRYVTAPHMWNLSKHVSQ